MIAVTYWEGWVLAHPAAVLIAAACAGTLAVLVLLMRAEDRRDDREDGIPETPRRGLRSRARGTRARRHLPASPCRRARAIRAWAASWFWWAGTWHPWQAARERIALRAHGITIDVTGNEPPTNVPGREGDGTDPKPQPAASTMGPRAASPGEPPNPAGGLTAAEEPVTHYSPAATERSLTGDIHGTLACGACHWGFVTDDLALVTCGACKCALEFEPTEAEEAYMAEHHPAALLTVGPPERPETEPNASERPETLANACEHAEPARLATGAERDAAEAAATRPWADDTGTFTRICAGGE